MKTLKKISLSVLIFLVVVFVAFYSSIILFPGLYVKPDRIKLVENQLNQMSSNVKVDLNSQNAVSEYDSGIFYKTKFRLNLQNPTINIDLSKKSSSSGLLAGLKNKLNKMMNKQEVFDNSSAKETTSDILTVKADKTQIVVCPFCDFIAIKSVDNLQGVFKNDKDSKFGINHLDAGAFNINKIIKKSSVDRNRKYNIHFNGLFGKMKGNTIRIIDLFYSHDVSCKLFSYLNKTTDKHIDEILSKYREYYNTIFVANDITFKSKNDAMYTVGNVRFNMRFKPDNKSYRFDANINAFNTNMTSLTQKSLYDILSGIYAVNMNFSINHLTVNLVSSLMGFKDKSKGFIQKIQGVFAAIRTDQPKIDISFKILHKYITVRSNGELIFTGYSFVPTGKIYTTITGVSNLETMLAKSNLLTDKVERILTALRNNRTSIIEVKSGMPFIYINDQPITELFKKIKEQKKMFIPQATDNSSQ